MEAKIENRIFILALKKSKKSPKTTYCVGVYKLGSPGMEFIMGTTNNDREYKIGEETSYIYDADYTNDLKQAMDWLNTVK